MDFAVLNLTDPWRTRQQCKLNRLLKHVFSNFRKVVHQISSAATWNRKENLKTHILMYSIGGWTGRANIHWSAHAIEGLRCKFSDFFYDFIIFIALRRCRNIFSKIFWAPFYPLFWRLLTKFSYSRYSLKYSNKIGTKFENQNRQIPSQFFFFNLK